jgi:hypothetical protein
MPQIHELEARQGMGYDEDYTFKTRYDAFYPEVYRVETTLRRMNSDAFNELIRKHALDFRVRVHQDRIYAYVGFKNKRDAGAFREKVLEADPLAKFVWYENRLLMEDDDIGEVNRMDAVNLGSPGVSRLIAGGVFDQGCV